MKRANLVHSAQEEIQKSICELKNLLRDALVNKHNNAVVSDRRTYKTSALIQFVAERMLVLPPPARVGIVCPNMDMTRRFALEYQMTFPDGPAKLRNPLVASIDEVLHGIWRGWLVPEVYAEEMFRIPWQQLREVPNFVAGIGTLHPPVSLRIEKW